MFYQFVLDEHICLRGITLKFCGVLMWWQCHVVSDLNWRKMWCLRHSAICF